MPPPKSLCDIQVFLGMTGYYCQFIPNYANLAEPMVQLFRKDLQLIGQMNKNVVLWLLKSLSLKPPFYYFQTTLKPSIYILMPAI